jgi:NDP-sugar pyrophosphorylase family protein
VNVTYSTEKKLLGTGGALKHAQNLVTAESFLVLNGDSFLGVDLRKMYHYHMARRALATIAVVPQPQSERYGTVEVDRYGRIKAFKEKNSDIKLMREDAIQLINGGIYIFQREFLELIPSGKVASLEKEVFPRLLGSGLFGFVTNGYFIDIGVPADFKRAQSELPKRFMA